MSVSSAAAVLPHRSRLDSWKKVGAFFNCNERTVKRWEKERGLPIRRLPGAARSRIFAEVAELEAWLRGASRFPEAAPVTLESAPRVYQLRLTSFVYRPFERAGVLQ